MKGQKEAVIECVVNVLGASYIPNQTDVLATLTHTQLEYIKDTLTLGIRNGTINYGKDRTNAGEVRAYARSMVMNHLKKSKELNGGKSTSAAPKKDSTVEKKSGIKKELLTPELKAFVEENLE